MWSIGYLALPPLLLSRVQAPLNCFQACPSPPDPSLGPLGLGLVLGAGQVYMLVLSLMHIHVRNFELGNKIASGPVLLHIKYRSFTCACC